MNKKSISFLMSGFLLISSYQVAKADIFETGAITVNGQLEPPSSSAGTSGHAETDDVKDMAIAPHPSSTESHTIGNPHITVPPPPVPIPSPSNPPPISTNQGNVSAGPIGSQAPDYPTSRSRAGGNPNTGPTNQPSPTTGSSSTPSSSGNQYTGPVNTPNNQGGTGSTGGSSNPGNVNVTAHP